MNKPVKKNHSKERLMKIKIQKIPMIISIALLLLSILPIWPYGYYTLLRLVICGTAVYLAYISSQINKQGWMWTMISIAILFNPVFTIHLNKVLWSFIDIIIAGIFIIYMSRIGKSEVKMDIKKVIKRISIAIVSIITLVIIAVVAYDYHYQNKTYPIELVKQELGYNKSPSERVKNKKGDITIYGWKTKRVVNKPKTFLVSYTYATAERKKELQRRGWFWEVNTKERIVRNIIGDNELEKKYGLYSLDKEQRLKDLISEKLVPKDKR